MKIDEISKDNVIDIATELYKLEDDEEKMMIDKPGTIKVPVTSIYPPTPKPKGSPKSGYDIMREVLKSDEWKHKETFLKKDLVKFIEENYKNELAGKKYKIQNTTWASTQKLKDGTTKEIVVVKTDERGVYSNPFYES